MPITEDVYDCHTQVQSTQHAMSKAEQRRCRYGPSIPLTSSSDVTVQCSYRPSIPLTSSSDITVQRRYGPSIPLTSSSDVTVQCSYRPSVPPTSSSDVTVQCRYRPSVPPTSSSDVTVQCMYRPSIPPTSSSDVTVQCSADIDLVFLQQALVISLSLFQSNKPIMEKRRRARINHCLNELKTLILDAMKKDPARHSKLEKADILEMTVKHLQTVQRQQLTVAMTTDPGVLHKFKTGFNECAGEVSRYISRMEGVEAEVKQRLIGHLANCVTGLQQLSPFSFGGGMGGALSAMAALQGGGPTLPLSPGDVNNNQHNSRLQGLHLIPSRLPTGELALLLPNSGQLPLFSSMAHAPTANNPNPSTTTPTNPAAVPATANAGFAPTSTVTSGSIDRGSSVKCQLFLSVQWQQCIVSIYDAPKSPRKSRLSPDLLNAVPKEKQFPPPPITWIVELSELITVE
uniref:Uncharacterized protein n=1 Tax=Timema genevievae TaxID=629358 RepID=A0A7R9PKI5_TIMGE|nr:unnamed protein product [Timema genevievae]